MKQRKGKKYNPKKLALYQSSKMMEQIKQVMDDWCVCFMAGDENCFVWNLDTGRELEAIDPELADVIILNRHMWRVQLYALCVDDFNVPYIKSDSLTVSESVTHGELLPYLNDAHSVLCSETNKRHFVRPAWLAYAGEQAVDFDKELPRLLATFEGRGGFVRCEEEIAA